MNFDFTTRARRGEGCPAGEVHWLVLDGRLQKSGTLENLPKSPKGSGRACPLVQKRFQVQLRDDISLAVGGNEQRALARHQDQRRMSVKTPPPKPLPLPKEVPVPGRESASRRSRSASPSLTNPGRIRDNSPLAAIVSLFAPFPAGFPRQGSQDEDRVPGGMQYS